MSGFALSAQMVNMIRANVTKFLTDNVTIQRETLVRTEYGSAKPNWVTIASVKARILPENPRDRREEVASREAATKRRRCILSYTDSVATGDRIVFADGNTYEVRTIVNDLTDRVFIEVEITAVSGVNDG